MDFDYYYLGFLESGKNLTIKINQQAYVALIDTPNLYRFINRQLHREYGQLQIRQIQRYRTPYPAEWHVIIAVVMPATGIDSDVYFSKTR